MAAPSAAAEQTSKAAPNNDSQLSMTVPSTSLAVVEDIAEDVVASSTWSGPDSWLEESCRRELAAAEALLPSVVVLPADAPPSEPQLVEPSPRGPPAAAATWRYLSDLNPAKLGMRAALPGHRVATRCESLFASVHPAVA